MARARLANPRRSNVLPSEQGQVARGHRTPKSGDEKGRVVRVGQESRSNLALVLVDPAKGSVADGNDPILRPLALSDEHRAAFGVDIVDPEFHGLASADAGRIDRFEDGPISKSKGIMDVRYR